MPLVRLILDFILTYGMESIIVYTALLLKKRVIVYCPENQLPQLMSIVRYGIHFNVNFCHLFIPQFIHHFLSIYFYHPSIYSSIGSSIHWSMYLLIDSSIHWYIDSSIDWSIHPWSIHRHPLVNPSIQPSQSKHCSKCEWSFFNLIPPSLLFRSLPALVWHRQNWDIAFPVVEIEDSEVDVLKETTSYVAGVTDASVEGR